MLVAVGWLGRVPVGVWGAGCGRFGCGRLAGAGGGVRFWVWVLVGWARVIHAP